MVPLNWAIKTDRKALTAGELAITAVLKRKVSAINSGIAKTNDTTDGVTGKVGQERAYESSCMILPTMRVWCGYLEAAWQSLGEGTRAVR